MAGTIALPLTGSPRPGRSASARHTGAVVAAVLAIALLGAVAQHRAGLHAGAAPHHPHMVPVFVALIVVEWALVYFIGQGLRATGLAWRDLAGSMPLNAKSLLLDAAVALGACICWLVMQAMGRALVHHNTVSIAHLLPRGALELSLWAGVAITAGICEELIFRGYLQRQFALRTGRPTLALAMQAALFGAAHLYQGVQTSVLIAFAGLLFGAVALWRRNLRPGMMAHTAIDLLPVLVYRLLHP